MKHYIDHDLIKHKKETAPKDLEDIITTLKMRMSAGHQVVVYTEVYDSLKNTFTTSKEVVCSKDNELDQLVSSL